MTPVSGKGEMRQLLPRCDPKRGQRGKQCCSSSSTSLSAPNVACDLHGSLNSGRGFLRPSPMTYGVSSSALRNSSGMVSSPTGASGRGAEGRSVSALRARDVRGCPGLVKSDGIRKPPGSKDSSVVVMHGHRMRSDFDLDSVFVPHSRSFSLCSSVVSKVSHSSQSINSCCRRCRSAVMDVAVIMQRQLPSEQWKCLRFSSSPELVDFFVSQQRWARFSVWWR